MDADFTSQAEAKDKEVAVRESEAELKIKAVEEMLQQTETDADKEIIEIKTR